MFRILALEKNLLSILLYKSTMLKRLFTYNILKLLLNRKNLNK